jgi:serine/threonine protein phosphatase PrpC
MTMTECAACADERAAGAAFCESCGRSLSAGPPCPHCGVPGAIGDDGYCEQCGMLAVRPRDHLEVDPDVASATAAGAAGELLASSTDVGAAILAAKDAVAVLAGSGDPRRAASNPACTIVAAVVRGAEVTFGWIGDSRAYWVPTDGPAQQLTEDDSWATHVIAMGVDPEVAMRDPKAHAITGWLGADAGSVQPRTGSFTVTEPGLLVLCSDGLWNYLTDPAAFGAAVRTGLREHGTLIDAARYLTDYANTAGGADNITVALVPVQPAPEE